MDPFETSHFSNRALLHEVKTLVGQDSMRTAVLLTRLAEIDRRKLFLREGYPSMFAFCVNELHLSDDAAYRRIQAARAARRFPAVLVALADGRLHLRAVLMLAPHLTSANADELVAAATHKSRIEIEQLLAQCFPRPDLPERLQAIPAASAPTLRVAHPAPGPVTQLAPERVEATFANPPAHGQAEGPRLEPACELAPERVESPAPRSRMTPLAPERFGLQITIDQETHDLLLQAQALMSHQIPGGEIAPMLKCALKLFVEHLEKRKFAATDRPGHSGPGTSVRHIPAHVKRAVRERDGGQCAFVSESGQRCKARELLEFDHRESVACGGEATVENVRLLCRAHNQYAAERAFGTGFMDRKRAEAQRARYRGKGAGLIALARHHETAFG